MTTVSVLTRVGLTYPSAGSGSPARRPPEYPFSAHQEMGDSDVYGLVRDCLAFSGADRENYGSVAWNPLGSIIQPGERVIVMPNLVMHRRRDRNETELEFQAKCTHGSIIRAVCDYATIATGSTELVTVGCAPLQSCDFDAVCEEARLLEVAEFYRRSSGQGLAIRDLRATHTRWTRFGALRNVRESGDEPWVGIDLGTDSLLEKHYQRSAESVEFRVGDYDPATTLAFHGRGRHEYAVSKAVLDSDVIISVPKLKTHEKVGITCALKGTVGAVARKECLAHHRLGPPEDGGDEYPAAGVGRRLVSELMERTATNRTDLTHNAQRVAAKGLARLARAGRRGVMNGAWHGNDTAWRMALDIARILRFARSDGTLAEVPQRRHAVLVDGIVAGEGEGPLRPSPRRAGLVVFSPDIVHADLACAQIMRFDPARIPLLRNARRLERYPLHDSSIDTAFVLDGSRCELEDLGTKVGLARFRPPKGWRDHLDPPR